MRRLPETLEKQLDAFRSRRATLLSMGALMAAARVFLLTVTTFCLLERVLDMGRAGRIGFFVLALGLPLVLIVKALIDFWARPSPLATARLVQRLFPEFGDRLQGAVELATDRETTTGAISPELREAALRQVAESAIGQDFAARLNNGPERFPRRAALVFAGCLALFATLFPRATVNSFHRLFLPLADVPRYAFVRLVKPPETLVVPIGEPGEFEARLAPDSALPSTATLTLAGRRCRAAFDATGRARFSLPPLSSPAIAALWAGDSAVERFLVRPLERPGLVSLDAVSDYPEYLKRTPQTVRVTGGRFAVPAGSWTKLTGVLSRPARTFSARDSRAPEAINLPVSLHGDRFSVGPFPVERGRTILLRWEDRHGLTPPTPYAVHAATAADRPPTVTHDLTAPRISILETERMDVATAVADDFGVKRVYLRAKVSDGKNERALPDAALADGDPETTTLRAKRVIDPKLAGIGPGESLFGEFLAEDYHPPTPDRPASSGTWRIDVIGFGEHARRLLDQARALNEKMDMIAQEEERGRERNRAALENLDKNELEAARRDSLRAESDETANRERTRALAERYAALAAEAARNPDIPAKTIGEWLKAAAATKSVASQLFPQAENRFKQAGAAKNQRQVRSARERALPTQQEIVKRLREEKERLDQSLDNAVGHSLALRLRRAAEKGEDTAERQKKRLSETAGKSIEELTSDERENGDRLAETQNALAEDVQTIQDDMNSLSGPRNDPKRAGVAEEMKTEKAVEGLQNVCGLYRQNALFRGVVQGKRWNGRLRDWANALGNGDAEKDGKDDERKSARIDMATLVAMGRLLSRETTLRERTREAEKAVRSAIAAQSADKSFHAAIARHIAVSGALATDQKAIAQTTRDLRVASSHPALRDLLKYLEKVMDSGAFALLRLDTAPRGKAIAAETEVIETLSKLFEQNASGQENNPLSAALAAMLGFKPGGGGPGGGRAEGPDVEGAGSGHPNASTPAADGLGGADPRDVPDEYRDDVERYFNNYEKIMNAPAKP